MEVTDGATGNSNIPTIATALIKIVVHECIRTFSLPYHDQITPRVVIMGQPPLGAHGATALGVAIPRFLHSSLRKTYALHAAKKKPRKIVLFETISAYFVAFIRGKGSSLRSL